jgi:hypothetical protein
MSNNIASSHIYLQGYFVYILCSTKLYYILIITCKHWINKYVYLGGKYRASTAVCSYSTGKKPQARARQSKFESIFVEVLNLVPSFIKPLERDGFFPTL